MIIEVILLIIILYVYIVFRNSWEKKPEDIVSTTAKTSDDVREQEGSDLLSSLATTTMIMQQQTTEIRITQETPEKVVVAPAYVDPVPAPDISQIRFPSNYDRSDFRKVECLANYRRMNDEKRIDFVQKPFQGTINSCETTVLLLDQLVREYGIELNFNQSQYKYDDSDYRTSQQNKDLGSIHSIISSSNQIERAKFQMSLDLQYSVVTQTADAIKQFVLKFINAIGKLIGCDPKFIQVFEIESAVSGMNNVAVKFGITARSKSETIELAEQLKVKIATKSTLQSEKDEILKHIIPKQYKYEVESVMIHLRLQKSDFDPNYNRPYPPNHPVKCYHGRGGRPYYFPIHWYRHALKVDDKYDDGDKAWLGDKGEPGEWSVAYHGTCDFAVMDIVHKGLAHDKVTADQYKQEAIDQKGKIADVKGIYLATHCEGGASKYAKTFTIKDDTGKERKYKMVFQCRVDPNKLTEHTGPGVDVGKILRVFDEKAIRPYGILLKEEKELGFLPICVQS